MSTTYGFIKQVESNQQGSKHTLAILTSKLRSSLGAAWEQPREYLQRRDYGSLATRLRLVAHEITARRIHALDAHIGK